MPEREAVEYVIFFHYTKKQLYIKKYIPEFLSFNDYFYILVIFGSFPYWPSAKNRLEELIPINDYTFHDRQFYFTFVM